MVSCVALWLINIPYIKKQKKIGYFYWDDMIWFGLGLWFMVCNATFYNSSVISWRSVWWWRKPEYTEKTKDLSFFVLSIFELCLTMSFFYLPWSSVFHLLMAFDNMLVHSDLTVFKVRVFPIWLSKSRWSNSAYLMSHCILLRVP